MKRSAPVKAASGAVGRARRLPVLNQVFRSLALVRLLRMLPMLLRAVPAAAAVAVGVLIVRRLRNR